MLPYFDATHSAKCLFGNRVKIFKFGNGGLRKMQMCKINELNNELYVIKVAKINESCMNNVKSIF